MWTSLAPSGVKRFTADEIFLNRVLSPEQQRESDHGQSRRRDPYGNQHYRQVPGAVSGLNGQGLGV